MIDAKTQLVGLIGSPVRHSLSPLMHNAAFANLGLNYAYLAFEVDDLKAAMGAVRALGMRGVNVTMPYKIAVLKYLDSIDKDAEKIGAVNTVVCSNGRLKGYNTDSSGAIAALEQRIGLKGRSVLLLGAGGAARAIGHGLSQKGARLTIASLDIGEAEALAKRVHANAVPISEAGNVEAEVLINATPVGMKPNHDKMPVSESVLKGKAVVFDIVYEPVQTVLLRTAAKLGCTTIGGIEMLVNQGVHSFKLWTGIEAPRNVMRSAVEQALGEQK